MIRDNIIKVKERISSACLKVGRDSGSITIVAVSKTRPPQEIKEAIEAGITDIGENRVQEALSKYDELSAIRYPLNAIKLHMVGHLQTNKAKEAVKLFDLIHSVDSLHLAQEIDKQAHKIDKVQDILVEIKTSPEATKSGLKLEDAPGVISEITGLKNVNIKGLMTIAPIVDDPEKARPYFKALRELKDKINKLSAMNHELTTLSMGMTDDYEAAIEEGSTMVRIGRAIFEG